MKITFWSWITLFRTLLTRIPDGIALFCSLQISSMLLDKHSVFLVYRNSDYFCKEDFKGSSCEEVFHVKIR